MSDEDRLLRKQLAEQHAFIAAKSRTINLRQMARDNFAEQAAAATQHHAEHHTEQSAGRRAPSAPATGRGARAGENQQHEEAQAAAAGWPSFAVHMEEQAAAEPAAAEERLQAPPQEAAAAARGSGHYQAQHIDLCQHQRALAAPAEVDGGDAVERPQVLLDVGLSAFGACCELLAL